MKKITLVVISLALLSFCFMGCSWMAGVDAPENFKVHAIGRTIYFSWDEVAGADHYVIETSGGGNKWEDAEVDGPGVLNNMSNLLNFTEYTFCVCAVNSMGIKGPKSDSQKVYMPYGFDNYWSLKYDQKEYSKSTDKAVTISWENIKTAGNVHVGAPGIEYRVYRLEGTSRIGLFNEIEGNEPVLVADHITPSSDDVDETMSFEDDLSNLEAGKAYQYSVQAYSDECNWEADRLIEVSPSGVDAKFAIIEE